MSGLIYSRRNVKRKDAFFTFKWQSGKLGNFGNLPFLNTLLFYILFSLKESA
jgi:hypothetical protein